MFGHDSKGYTKGQHRRLAVACMVGLTVGLAKPVVAIDLISVATNGRSGSAASNGVATNLDGSVVAFYSDATNLVPGDTNAVRDVFVRDVAAGTTQRINLGPGGAQANAASHAAGGPPAISADGNIIVFYSSATNLLEENDTNGVSDIFVYNRQTERMNRINLTPTGGQANGASLAPDINADGRFIAYQSLASNLVEGDTNGASDVFVYDTVTGTTERICDDIIEPNNFSFAPSISPCGQFVAFASGATNLVPDDTNGLTDVFVCNRRTGEIDRVSIGIGGQGNGISIVPDISLAGCFVAFKSEADNLVPNDFNDRVDVFVRDRGVGVTELISKSIHGGSANDASFPPSITHDGRFVAFGSAATDLLLGDVNNVPSVYVRDRSTGGIRLVDVNDAGQQANGGTPDVATSISGDGSQIGFVSAASNLTAQLDQNSTNDVFRAANEFDPLMVGNICCDCDDGTCTEPDGGGLCPDNCVPVCNAICDPGLGECLVEPTPPMPTDTPGTPTVSATPSRTPTGPTATATPTGPTATATPTGPTATATATGPTATATPTGPTATATHTGNTATPTATGGTATPTATGPTATATHTGGTATPTHTGGTATPTGTLNTATPTQTGGTATPTSTGGTATPTQTGNTATPTGTLNTATPTGTRNTATPTGTLNTATPTRTGGTATPDRTQTAAAGGRRFDDDGCAVMPPDETSGSSTGALLLLGPLALLVMRRRRT